MLATHPEIVESELDGLLTKFMVLTYESPTNCRDMRFANAPPEVDSSIFTLRWTSYRSEDPNDDGEGGCYGNLEVMVTAIDQFLVERRHWSQVPAFRTMGDAERRGGHVDGTEEK